MQKQSAQPRPAHPLRRAAILALPFGIGMLAALVALSAAEERAVDPVLTQVAALTQPARVAIPTQPPAAAPDLSAPPEPEHVVLQGVLRPGQSLAAALRAEGQGPELADLIAREMQGSFDFRNAQPGQRWRLVLDASGQMLSFHWYTAPTSGYSLVRSGDGWRVRRDEMQLVARNARLAGLVKTTLYQAVVDLGESGQLARDFAEVFAWDIDFQRSVQPGDQFSMLYERLYRVGADGSEVYVRPGRILAARYEGVSGQHTAVYFEPEEGRGGYYRPDGSSVQRQFLMAPLRHARITSRFSLARLHPILNIVRPHHGIDYAAPLGTPVWAVAEGSVIFRGRAGGFGNLVKIRHSNGYVSFYGHLSRFAKGLRVGQKVAQKQVIGYVGQTGLATGPHVCFRITKDGKYVNPARIRTPAGEPVPATLLPKFRSARDVLLAELGAGTLIATEDYR